MSMEKIVTIDGKNYKLLKPTVGETTEADISYSKAYTLALKNGIIPRAAMESEIIKNDLWPQENEDRLDLAGEKLQLIVQRIRDPKNSNEDKDLAKSEFIQVRNEVIQLNTMKQSLYSHTCEAKGDEAKVSFLMTKCIFNEDGSKVWSTATDFANERDVQKVESLVQELISFTSGLDDKIKQMDELLKSPNQQEGEGTEDAKTEAVVTEEPKA